MKAQAKYVFEKLPNLETRFILRQHFGIDISGFPCVWVADNHPHKGEGYIIFTNLWGKQNSHPAYCSTHALHFGKDRPESERLCTGLNFFPEFPYKTYGTYQDNALLIQFSEDWKTITIWVFKGMRELKHALFQKWIAGELVEIVEADVLPIPA